MVMLSLCYLYYVHVAAALVDVIPHFNSFTRIVTVLNNKDIKMLVRKGIKVPKMIPPERG